MKTQSHARVGSLARTAILAATKVDEVTAVQVLAAVERTLSDAQWHVLVPEEGMARVLASTGEAMRQEVQAVHVAATGRFALMGTWSPVVVGETAAAEALGVES